MIFFIEISTQRLPTCAALLFCLRLDLRLVNNGEGQLPWHGTDENHSTANKKDKRKNLGLNALTKELGVLLRSSELSSGQPASPPTTVSHSYTIHNRSQVTVEKVLSTKWIVTVSYEELQPPPEMAESRRYWSSCSLRACWAQRCMINIHACPTLFYSKIQFT